jgi:hypothetical protein
MILGCGSTDENIFELTQEFGEKTNRIQPFPAQVHLSEMRLRLSGKTCVK